MTKYTAYTDKQMKSAISYWTNIKAKSKVKAHKDAVGFLKHFEKEGDFTPLVQFANAIGKGFNATHKDAVLDWAAMMAPCLSIDNDTGLVHDSTLWAKIRKVFQPRIRTGEKHNAKWSMDTTDKKQVDHNHEKYSFFELIEDKPTAKWNCISAIEKLVKTATSKLKKGDGISQYQFDRIEQLLRDLKEIEGTVTVEQIPAGSHGVTVTGHKIIEVSEPATAH